MRNIKSRAVAFAATASAAALALAACGGGSSTTEPAKSGDSGAAAGKEITAAVAYETKNFDPVGSASALAMGANLHVVEGLYEFDMHNFQPYAALAKGDPVKVSDTEYEVTLRDGAKFSDGKDVTVDDVVKSAEAAIDNKLYAGFFTFMDSVAKKDDKTVTFKTKFPFSLLKNRLVLMKVVPASMSPEDRTKMPIGTGPWKYKSIDEKQIEFEANPHYNGPNPAKSPMKWQIIKDDVARSTAMQGGTVNVMESVPFDAEGQIKAAKATVESVQGFNLPFLMFNNKKAPFDKKEVRQAFFYAINTDKLVNEVMHGQAEAATSFLPKSFKNYHEAKVVYKQDVAKAKELLAAAGVPSLSVKLLTTDHPWITKLAPQIKQDLEAVGIKTEVNSLQSAALYSNHADKGDFDVVLAPGDPSVFGDDPDLLMNWWYGPNVWTEKRSGWAGTPAFEQLHKYMDAAVRTTGEAQQAEWNKAFDLLSEEVPLYPLFHRQVVTGFQAEKLDGYKPIGTTGLDFIGVAAK